MAMPFFVITVESGLRSMNRRLEDAARSLGAKRLTVFRRVTLPLIWPSLAAGTVLTWARALGEFGATITFAGNLPGRTQTMPLAIYVSQSSSKMAEAIALSLVLVVVSLVVMVFRRRLCRRGTDRPCSKRTSSCACPGSTWTRRSRWRRARWSPCSGRTASGKSTTLRALMGLLPLAGGRVVLDGTVLEDPAQRVKVAPENRPIGLMFQDYLLFPHLSAVENVAFGLRCRGTDKKTGAGQARAGAGTAGPGGCATGQPGRDVRRPAAARGHGPRPGDRPEAAAP